jgi:hypothetical protein
VAIWADQREREPRPIRRTGETVRVEASVRRSLTLIKRECGSIHIHTLGSVAECRVAIRNTSSRERRNLLTKDRSPAVRGPS